MVHSAAPLQRAYFGAFALALALCWSPLNLLGYLAPFAVLAWLIVGSNDGWLGARLLACLACLGLVIAARGLLQDDFVLHSAALSVLTLGTAIFIIAVPSSALSDGSTHERIMRLIPPFVLLQAALGLIQAFYGAATTGSFDVSNGDYVEGTIHPSLESERAFSNVMFASNMAFMLVGLVPGVLRSRRGWLALAVGALAFILASVLHVFLFLLLAAGMAYLLFRPRLPGGVIRVILILLAIGVPLFAYRVLARNFAIIPSVIAVFGESPKARFTVRVVERLPESSPWAPMIGEGPGQLGSRASLIGTGLYFGTPKNPRDLPFLPEGMSKAFRTYAMDLWWEFSNNPYYGSTQQPFSSWLSLYAEWGILAVLFVIAATAYVLLRALRSAVNEEQRAVGFSFATGVLLLVLLGVQENYWEVPQAILIGVMLLKLQYGLLISRSRHEPLLARALADSS